MNKKFILTLSLLANYSLWGMNGHVKDLPLTTDVLNEKMSDIFGNDELTSVQKLIQLRLFLQHAADTVRTQAFHSVMSPTEGEYPLEEALTTYESPEMFKLLLAFHANAQVRRGKKTIEEQARLKKAFMESIVFQGHVDKVAPAVTQVIAGEDEAVVASILKNLVSEGAITKDDVYTILDALAIEKEEDAGKIDNLALAFESLMDNKPYVKRSRAEKKALRAQLASSYSFKHVLGAFVIGGAIAIGGKLLWDSSQEWHN